MRHHHVVMALGNSWGRARMAHGIATALSTNGEHVTVLANQTLAPKLTGSGFRTQAVRDMGPLLRLYLDGVIATHAPDTLVLCDYPSNATVLQRNGVPPAALLREDLRVCALDIWDTALTGVDPDVFGGPPPTAASPAWVGDLARTERLHPVPILWPRAEGGRHFCYLPSPASSACSTTVARAETRERLGIGRDEKIVLFCTAQWQHLAYASAAGRRAIVAIPRLVADYVHDAGRDVHVVHVGPQPFDLADDRHARYHWVAPLGTEAFDRLLASADLLLSANIAASTVASAMLLDVPTLILQNAVRAERIEHAEAAVGGRLSDRLRRWLAASLPLYPFALWPIGFHRFLAPALRDNPYADALTVVELLDEPAVAAALTRLLRDPGARADQVSRQTRYLHQIRSLPSVVELIAARN